MVALLSSFLDKSGLIYATIADQLPIGYRKGGMMQEKLKPCPFCGKRPKTFLETIAPNIKRRSRYVQCMNDFCPLWDKFYISDWNRRAK